MSVETEPGRSPGTRFGKVVRVAAVLGTVLFVALLAYGLVAKAPNTGIDESLAQAEAPPAPGFELPVLQEGSLGSKLRPELDAAIADGRIALEELRRKPVVLNFWASWCVPCREEAPLLERSWREARDRGDVVFVGLNMQDLTEDARAFMREFDVSYLNVRDESNAIARKWGVTGLPETFFVTAGGEVVSHVIGVISESQMREGLAAARSGRPAGAVSGGEQRSVR